MWRRVEHQTDHRSMALCTRYYSSGSKWPLLSLSLYSDHLSQVEPVTGIKVSASRKKSHGDWWIDCGVPIELVDELTEMLAEVRARL
jgi:hypothetical protein